MVSGDASPNQKGGLSSTVVYTFMGLMIVTGSINTIANKLQNNSESLGKPYQHVWFITFCMFLGETTCMLWYAVWRWRQPKDENGELIEEGNKDIKEASPFMLAIPALCDFFGSTIMTFGLTMMAGSVYQMFRGSLIFFTALLSVIFLKNKLYRHNYLALVIVITGLLLVGLASKIFPPDVDPDCGDGDGGTKDSFWGIILVVIAQVFSATQMIIEEKFMKGYHCHPLKAVGWEGFWGSLIYIILLIIFQFVPCEAPPQGGKNLSSYICSPNDKNEWKLEDTIFAFRQMGDNGLLLFYVILYICSIALFNFVGISVSKYASSPARAVVDTVRTIVVWGFFLMPFINKCYREHFNWLQLVGFILLVIGTVIYNEVLVLPFLGFDQYTKKALANKEKLLDSNETSNNDELNSKIRFSNNSETTK
jgi:drug/metabolite transporter (DMT)-like permease